MLVDYLRTNLEGQTGLPAPAGADARDEPRVTDGVTYVRELVRTADKTRHLHRKVVGNRAERPQLREVRLEPRMAELPDPLWSAEVLQLVDAERAKRDIGRQMVGYEIVRRVGDQSLSAMGDSPHSRAADDGPSVIVRRIPQIRLAGVKRYPDPSRRLGLP